MAKTQSTGSTLSPNELATGGIIKAADLLDVSKTINQTFNVTKSICSVMGGELDWGGTDGNLGLDLRSHTSSGYNTILQFTTYIDPKISTLRMYAQAVIRGTVDPTTFNVRATAGSSHIIAFSATPGSTILTGNVQIATSTFGTGYTSITIDTDNTDGDAYQQLNYVTIIEEPESSSLPDPVTTF